MSRNPVSNAEMWQEAVAAWVSYLEDVGRRPWNIVHYGSVARRFTDWTNSRGFAIIEVRLVDIEELRVPHSPDSEPGRPVNRDPTYRAARVLRLGLGRYPTHQPEAIP